MSNALFVKVMGKHYAADDLLEQGVMAELDGKPNPQLFRDAFKLFEETAREMDAMQTKLDDLIAIHKKGESVKVFDESLSKIFADMDPVERVSLQAGRFSNVSRAQKAPTTKQPTNLLEVMEAQRADLMILRKQLTETIDTFRAVIPLAEKKQFVPMMLSGRAGFSSKVQQSVNLLGIYSRSYSRGCMATIEATMQAYPAGLEWLPKVADDVAAVPPLVLPAPVAPEVDAGAAPAADAGAPPPKGTAAPGPGSPPPSPSGGCACRAAPMAGGHGGQALAAVAFLVWLGRRARRGRSLRITS